MVGGATKSQLRRERYQKQLTHSLALKSRSYGFKGAFYIATLKLTLETKSSYKHISCVVDNSHKITTKTRARSKAADTLFSTKVQSYGFNGVLYITALKLTNTAFEVKLQTHHLYC